MAMYLVLMYLELESESRVRRLQKYYSIGSWSGSISGSNVFKFAYDEFDTKNFFFFFCEGGMSVRSGVLAKRVSLESKTKASRGLIS